MFSRGEIMQTKFYSSDIAGGGIEMYYIAGQWWYSLKSIRIAISMTSGYSIRKVRELLSTSDYRNLHANSEYLSAPILNKNGVRRLLTNVSKKQSSALLLLFEMEIFPNHKDGSAPQQMSLLDEMSTELTPAEKFPFSMSAAADLIGARNSLFMWVLWAVALADKTDDGIVLHENIFSNGYAAKRTPMSAAHPTAKVYWSQKGLDFLIDRFKQAGIPVREV